MNSRSEFNRCALPRITLKVGNMDSQVSQRKQQEESDEKLREEMLEAKINKLRSDRNKILGKQRAPKRSNNPPKRLKMLTSDLNVVGVASGGSIRYNISKNKEEKRSDRSDDDPPDRAPKRTKLDMRDYLPTIRTTPGTDEGILEISTKGVKELKSDEISTDVTDKRENQSSKGQSQILPSRCGVVSGIVTSIKGRVGPGRWGKGGRSRKGTSKLVSAAQKEGPKLGNSWGVQEKRQGKITNHFKGSDYKTLQGVQKSDGGGEKLPKSEAKMKLTQTTIKSYLKKTADIRGGLVGSNMLEI